MRLPKYTQYRIYWWCNGCLKRLELFKRYFHLNDSTNMARKGITEFYVLCKGRPKTQNLLKRWKWKYSTKMCQLMSKLFPQNINQGSSIKCVRKIFQKLTFPTPWYAHVRVHIWGVRNVNFSENFAQVHNGWPFTICLYMTMKPHK